MGHGLDRLLVASKGLVLDAVGEGREEGEEPGEREGGKEGRGASRREGRSVESLGVVLTCIDMFLLDHTRTGSLYRPIRSPRLLQPPQIEGGRGGGEQVEQVWGESLGKGKRVEEGGKEGKGGVLAITMSHLRLHKCEFPPSSRAAVRGPSPVAPRLAGAGHGPAHRLC